jgi:hypothetical protein
MNQLYFTTSFSDTEIVSENFSALILQKAKILKPYLDYLNEIFE